MKKVIMILVMAAMALSLAACGGGGNKEPEFDPQAEFEKTVENEVNAYCILNYDTKLVTTDITNVDVEDNIYTASGKATITDNYDDKFTAKITGTYKFNEESETFTKQELDIETPTKER